MWLGADTTVLVHMLFAADTQKHCLPFGIGIIAKRVQKESDQVCLLSSYHQWAEADGSLDSFTKDQLYTVIVLANGGPDLEAFTFPHAGMQWRQACSIFWQVAKSVAQAEALAHFEVRHKPHSRRTSVDTYKLASRSSLGSNPREMRWTEARRKTQSSQETGNTSSARVDWARTCRIKLYGWLRTWC